MVFWSVTVVRFLALIFVGLLVRWLKNYICALHFIKAHGCEPEPKLPQTNKILGYDAFCSIRKASREKRILKHSLMRYEQLGTTWSAVMVGRTYFNTIQPENVKAILSTKFNDFCLGPRLAGFFPLLGEGIFTTDGAHWETSRALVRPNLTKAHISQLDRLEVHLKYMLDKIPKDGSTVDIQPLFFELALDSSTELLFGESVNSLNSQKGSEQDRFGHAFDLAESRLPLRHRLGKAVYFHYDPAFHKACKEVRQFTDKIVEEAVQRSLSTDKERSPDNSRYVFLHEMVKSTHDRRLLGHEVLNLLFAGRDTTASLLANTFHVLARRPDIWRKLKNEVDATFQGALPDYDTLKNMNYLKNLVHESLRLYPVVPINGRYAKRDTTLPMGGGADGKSPVFVPKGAFVAYHTYSMHRQKSVYGMDAEEFRPERWNPEEGLRPGWSYLPFNGGPRVCLGQMYSLIHVYYVIARIAQEYDHCIDMDGTEWVELLSLTVCPDGGVKVKMIKDEKASER